MSGWEQTTKYRCDSDCRESGCPGHEVVISYRNTSDTFSYRVDDGEQMFIEVGLMEKLIAAWLTHRGAPIPRVAHRTTDSPIKVEPAVEMCPSCGAMLIAGAMRCNGCGVRT